MTDIEHAKQLLTGEGYTCVICRGDDIHTSQKRGVAPLMELLDGGADIRGYSAADKAVGKAAAMLFVLLGVGEIYAVVMSRSAKKILDEYGIKYSCGEEVEYIINRKKDGMCPMEKAVVEIDDPSEAQKEIKETIEKMRKGG
jgi:hypothetical protein